MRKFVCLSAILLASAAIGCGGDPAPTTCAQLLGAAACADAAIGPDGTTDNDTPVGVDTAPADRVATDGGTDARPDVRPDVVVPTDGPASRAGQPCTGMDDPSCGDLTCQLFPTTTFCSGDCDNDPSQTVERAACGGTGSTCLLEGDPPGQTLSFCTHACRTTAMTAATGACGTGQVCTGWWYTHAGARPDSTGCWPFCDADSQCDMGMHCNPRTGRCGTTGVDMTRLPDGSPCNPMTTTMLPGEMTASNHQCRGNCWRISSNTMQGICGSQLNLRVSTMCPDDPDNTAARAPQGQTDNLAICIWRNCNTNTDCRSPHICRYPEDAMMMPVTDAQPQCDYPTTAQRTGIVTGGDVPPDAAVDATPDVARDVTPTDIATGG